MEVKRNAMAAALGALLVTATLAYAGEKAETRSQDTGAIANSPITLNLATEFAQNYTDGRAVHAELKRDRGYYEVDVETGGARRQVRISAIDGRILADQPADD